MPTRLHVGVMPTSLLIDAAGNLNATHASFKPADEAKYAAEIEQLLSRIPAE